MVFFGLRGCLPVDEDDHEFRESHNISISDINHIRPRCTLGQWLPTEGKIALFLGSTVPHLRYVKASVDYNGQNANQLMTGFYKDYRKGVHKVGTPTAHSAFRQTEAHPIRRTADDFDYDNDDRVEFENPYDNLHAGWCMGKDHDFFASAGCQVVAGYPECPQRGEEPDAGPWKIFKENAYRLPLTSFSYILLSGHDAQKVILNGEKKMFPTLRFGSRGDLVMDLQKALQLHGYYEGNIDNDFGGRTIRAVLAFQTAKFGPNADDGVVGPLTASALGLSWPEV